MERLEARLPYDKRGEDNMRAEQVRELKGADYGVPPSYLSRQQILTAKSKDGARHVPAPKIIGREEPTLFCGTCFAGNMYNRLKALGYNVNRVYTDLGELLYPLQTLFQDFLNLGNADHFDKLRGMTAKVDGKYTVEHFYDPNFLFPSEKLLHEAIDRVEDESSWMADHYVFTLGGLECWHDTWNDIYSPRTVREDHTKGRYALSVWGLDEVRGTLSKVVEKCRELNPKCDVTFTISPQPPGAVFQKKPLHMAFWEQKAILRHAAGEMADNRGVYYFPSFEIVLFPGNKPKWALDGRHVTHDTIGEVFEKFRDAFFREEAEAPRKNGGEEDILKEYARHVEVIEAALDACDFDRAAKLCRAAAEYITDNELSLPEGLIAANDAYHKVAEGFFASGRYEELKPFLRHVMVRRNLPNNVLQLYNISVRATEAEAEEKGAMIEEFYREYSGISSDVSSNGDLAARWINFAGKVNENLGHMNYHRIYLVAGAYYHAARAVLNKNPEQGKKYLASAIETNPSHRAAYRLLDELKE